MKTLSIFAIFSYENLYFLYVVIGQHSENLYCSIVYYFVSIFRLLLFTSRGRHERGIHEKLILYIVTRIHPPICKHNARIIMGLEGIRMIEASLPGKKKRSPPPPPHPRPISSGGECSHDGFGKDSFALKQAGMALRSRALPPPFANTMLA